MDSIPAFRVLSGATNELHLTDNMKSTHFRFLKEDLKILKGLAIGSEYYWKERKELDWN